MSDRKNTYLPFDLGELDESSMKIVLREIGETEETKVKSLRILRKELESWTDIESCLDEQFLLAFLRVCKFNESKAIHRIRNYYKQQETLVDRFKNISIPYQKAKSLKHIFISPYKTKNNSLLVMVSAGIDCNAYSLEERFYLESLLILEFLAHKIDQMCGLTLIIDYAGFNFRSLCEYTPWKLKWFVDVTVNSLPIRFKGFHFVNAPSLFSSFYHAFYRLLPKKIKERVFIHPNDNWKSLHAQVPADILPEKYGGKLTNSSMIDCIDLVGLENLEKKFHKQLEFGYKKTKQQRLSLKVLY